MPCYQVNTISVEFNGKSIAILNEIGGRLVNRDIWRVGDVTINTKTGVASGRQADINAIKRQYSRAAVKIAAKKKGWTVARKGEGQFQLVKY